MDIKKALETRKTQKARKPAFFRKSMVLKRRLSHRWVKPKGHQNKMRCHLKGNPRCVSIGYRSPAAVRGLTRAGYEPVIVNNAAELSKINPLLQIAVISASVGQRKRLLIAAKAKELKLKIHNLKNAEKYMDSVSKKIIARKEEKNAKLTKKEEKAKEAQKKAQQKEIEDKRKLQEESKLSEAERAELEKEESNAEKLEKDRLLKMTQ